MELLYDLVFAFALSQLSHHLLTHPSWHGAAATTAGTHIAIVEQRDGRSADWMEKVGEEQYRAESGTRQVGTITARP